MNGLEQIMRIPTLIMPSFQAVQKPWAGQKLKGGEKIKHFFEEMVIVSR